MSPVNCHDARALMMAYLDSELDAATTVSVREHLRTCERCERRFEGEERVERALAASLAEGAMPEDVARRLDDALLEARRAHAGRRSGASASGDHTGGPRPERRSGRRRADAWRWTAAAALLLLAVTLVLMDDGVPREEAPGPLGDFVGLWETESARRAALPATLPARDARAIRALLDGAQLSSFEFPGDGRVHDHAVQLLGAREESFNGHRGVNLLYDCCGELTSVFVLPSGTFEVIPHELRVDGVRTRTVIRDGMLIGVVSRHASGLAEQWSG